MKAFAKTDIGKAREINEDSYYISTGEDDIKVFIVADGMGGYNGGEIASKMAVNSAKRYIQSNFKDMDKNREKILELVKNSIEYANMVVFENSKENKELNGMGTTLEICLIYENKVYIGHVGDSRIYRVRKNIIRKLTTDHSYVETLVKDGKITRQEAENHPKKNMLMKALGCTAFVEPDVMVKGFLKGDIVLMTTDGLTNMVNDTKLYEIVTNNVENSAEILVNEANNLGGYDNITVVTIYND